MEEKNTRKYTTVRQYLVNLQRWRSLAALFACMITFYCSGWTITASLVYYSQMGWELTDYFRYFTTLSNMMTSVAAAFIIPFAINGIRLKRFVYPRWLALFHYSGVVFTTLTFVFSMVFILPWDPEFALGNGNFVLHVVCPIAIFIAYQLVESDEEISNRELVLCLSPFLLYCAVYVVMVVFVGEGKGGWEDLYMLNTFVPAYVSLPAVWVLIVLLALGIRKLSNIVKGKRRRKLIARWDTTKLPVSIKVEMYGLGRFHGLHGEGNELGIPYDLIYFLAQRYDMKMDELLRPYVKGLSHGFEEKKEMAKARAEGLLRHRKSK